MEITIIETNELTELSIIDPKSGCDWTNDLMGNHNELPEYDDDTGYYNMSQEDFNWWDTLITDYQVADDRYQELLNRLDGDAYDNCVEAAHNINCDLEDHPRSLSEICEEFDI